MVNCKAGKSWEIASDALKIENVKMSNAVTGQFDVVAYLDFPNMEVLTDILARFQSMDGVEQTRTAVVILPRLE
ncbi:Lrp/AsnC ligand binding domain-containing protein [Candidatus Bathyarchaeota archaeon]|nr:Lrp/AsnC ligand binding domain-containing protein [Candidatus Bathyarchaeota archaeon]